MAATRFWFVLAVLSGAPLPAQGGVTWTERFPANSPSPRVGHSMVYDEARGRVLLFGGTSYSGGTGTTLADTWEWDGNSWIQRTPAVSPAVRDMVHPVPREPVHAMVYDAARQRVVLYGSFFLGDTWEWDGANWLQRFPRTSPGDRFDHAMAYDRARQRTVLYSGVHAGRRMLDTWEWDGTNWTLRDSRGGPGWVSPVMTFDPVRQRVLNYQGYDTWEWDGTSWTRLPGRQTRWTQQHEMVSDLLRQRVVRFGGNVGGAGIVSDVWEWDGTDWSQRLPAVRPFPRLETATAYDSARGRVVLFGGWDTLNVRGDTWEYHPVSPASYAPFGGGCPGGAGVPALGAAPFDLPWIDHRFTVDVRNVAAGSGTFLVTGLSNTSWRGQPLPLSLAPFGLPAFCNALVSVDAVAFAFGTGTTASFGIPICNCPTLIGATFHHQALVLDPAGPVVSNAATGVVGGR